MLWYLQDECGDFVNIWHNYQVPCIAHACKIVFGSVLNWSNYGHLFIHFVHLLWYLKELWIDFIHIWYSNQLPCVADACKISFGCIPNLNNYDFFLTFMHLLQYLWNEWADFIHIWYSNTNQVPCVADVNSIWLYAKFE